MADIARLNIPEGFSEIPPRGPFWRINGPMFKKNSHSGTPPEFAFLPTTDHCNALGFVHGGMIASILDSSMAQSIFDAHHCKMVTTNLNTTFLNAVARGRWSTVSVTLNQPVDETIRATATLMSRGRECANAIGLFKLFPNKNSV